jgi:hypothetical protein
MTVGRLTDWAGIVGADVGVEVERRVLDEGREHEPSRRASARAARWRIGAEEMRRLRGAERPLNVDAF